MAIFHFSVKPIRRAAGRSLVAALAYRAGVTLTCQRTGTVHDYRGRSGVVQTLILTPAGAVLERETLANALEAAETRINSVVGREFELALPHELDEEARARLAVAFTNLLMARYDVVADLAIHAPSRSRRRLTVGNEADLDEIGRGPDPRNHHCHIVTSTRAYAGQGYVFGSKIRKLDDLKSGAIEVAELRAAWADLCNAALEAAGSSERVDHRSNLARGIGTVPLGKIGVAAIGFERRTGERSDRRLMLETQQQDIQAAFAELDAAKTKQARRAAAVASGRLDRRDQADVRRPSPERPAVSENSSVRATKTAIAARPIEVQHAAPEIVELPDPVRRQAHLNAFAALRREAAAVDRALLQKLLDASAAVEANHAAVPAEEQGREATASKTAQSARRLAVDPPVSASTPNVASHEPISRKRSRSRAADDYGADARAVQSAISTSVKAMEPGNGSAQAVARIHADSLQGGHTPIEPLPAGIGPAARFGTSDERAADAAVDKAPRPVSNAILLDKPHARKPTSSALRDRTIAAARLRYGAALSTSRQQTADSIGRPADAVDRDRSRHEAEIKTAAGPDLLQLMEGIERLEAEAAARKKRKVAFRQEERRRSREIESANLAVGSVAQGADSMPAPEQTPDDGASVAPSSDASRARPGTSVGQTLDDREGRTGPQSTTAPATPRRHRQKTEPKPPPTRRDEVETILDLAALLAWRGRLQAHLPAIAEICRMAVEQILAEVRLRLQAFAQMKTPPKVLWSRTMAKAEASETPTIVAFVEAITASADTARSSIERPERATTDRDINTKQ